MRSARTYEMLDRIGSGGMAEVFRARVSDAGGGFAWVVVKKILRHHSHDEQYVQMFLDEARIASVLDSPQVVRLLDFGRMDGQLFIAFEYVDGADLRTLAKRAKERGGGVPLPIALLVMDRLLGALDYAHTRTAGDGTSLEIVHRDVSLSNVLLSRQGEVKLSDFGVARATVRERPQTVAGTVTGNLHFMAPEHLGGMQADARADVYGAGMVLHVLLTGRHPFEDDAMPLVITRVLRGDIPPPSTFLPSIPSSLDQIAVKATNLWPGFRYPSAADFRMALANEAVASGRVPASQDELARWVTSLAGGRTARPTTILERATRVVEASEIEQISEYRSEAPTVMLESPTRSHDLPLVALPDPELEEEQMTLTRTDDMPAGAAKDRPIVRARRRARQLALRSDPNLQPMFLNRKRRTSPAIRFLVALALAAAAFAAGARFSPQLALRPPNAVER